MKARDVIDELKRLDPDSIVYVNTDLGLFELERLKPTTNKAGKRAAIFQFNVDANDEARLI